MTKNRSVSTGLPRADHGLPPAGLARDRMHIGDMLVAGQRMADEHRVRFVVVERRHRSGRRRRRARGCAAVERSGSSAGKCTTGFPALATCARCELLPLRLVRFFAVVMAHSELAFSLRTQKIPAGRRQGRVACTRPFSELFRVAASRPAKSPLERRLRRERMIWSSPGAALGEHSIGNFPLISADPGPI